MPVVFGGAAVIGVVPAVVPAVVVAEVFGVTTVLGVAPVVLDTSESKVCIPIIGC